MYTERHVHEQPNSLDKLGYIYKMEYYTMKMELPVHTTKWK